MTELSVSKMMKPEISRSIPKPAFNTQFFNFLLGMYVITPPNI